MRPLLVWLALPLGLALLPASAQVRPGAPTMPTPPPMPGAPTMPAPPPMTGQPAVPTTAFPTTTPTPTAFPTTPTTPTAPIRAVSQPAKPAGDACNLDTAANFALTVGGQAIARFRDYGDDGPQAVALRQGIQAGPALMQWAQSGENARQAATIVVSDQNGRELARIGLSNAWISKLTGPGLNAQSSDVAVQWIELEFAQKTVSCG